MPRLEEIRKAVLGVVSVGLVYAGVAADVLGHSDLSSEDGVISAVFALLVGLGIYKIPNANTVNGSF